MSTLTKTQFPAGLAVVDQQEAAFVTASDADDPAYWRTVSMDLHLWRELGEPDMITVTIEPGDLLNGR